MWHQLLETHVLIMYDGTCGFCNEYIQFILNRNPSRKLKFVSSQSEIGKEIIQSLSIKGFETSIIVVTGQEYYKKSKAVFIIMKYLGKPWKYVAYLQIIPTFVTAIFYNILSKYRYKLAGKYCRLISKEEQAFFL